MSDGVLKSRLKKLRKLCGVFKIHKNLAIPVCVEAFDNNFREILKMDIFPSKALIIP